MRTQNAKKVPIGTRVPKYGPTLGQWAWALGWLGIKNSQDFCSHQPLPNLHMSFVSFSYTSLVIPLSLKVAQPEGAHLKAMQCLKSDFWSCPLFSPADGPPGSERTRGGQVPLQACLEGQRVPLVRCHPAMIQMWTREEEWPTTICRVQHWEEPSCWRQGSPPLWPLFHLRPHRTSQHCMAWQTSSCKSFLPSRALSPSPQTLKIPLLSTIFLNSQTRIFEGTGLVLATKT